MVNVLIHSAQDNLPERLGEYLLNLQNKALATGTTFKVAISGGSLVNVLNKALLQDENIAAHIKWAQWEIYFVDERIVPLTHEDSNYGAFKTAVLDHLSAEQQPKVAPLDETMIGGSNEKIAEAYESLLPKVFDSLLLGCGPDGHTCSLFPDQEHRYLINEQVKRVMWCHDSPKPPSDRITVTLPVLADAQNIAFVAEGSSKQPIMHEIFDLKNDKLPTALINKLYGDKVTWFVNDEAFTKVETTTF